MNTEIDIEALAERFDALYTELTWLQRQLIAAARGDLAGDGDRELSERAAVMLAAFETAKRALQTGSPSPREVEAAALRARLLGTQPDSHLVLAVLGAQGRTHAYPLLAELIERARSQEVLLETFGDGALEDFLAAPRGLGDVP